MNASGDALLHTFILPQLAFFNGLLNRQDDKRQILQRSHDTASGDRQPPKPLFSGGVMDRLYRGPQENWRIKVLVGDWSR